MQQAVDAILQTAESLRFVRDTQGDLPWMYLDAVQNGLRASKVATYAVFAEAPKQLAFAEQHMASIGGPASIAEYQAKAVQVEIAASAWNAFLTGFVEGLPHTALIAIVVQSYDNIQTKHIERPGFIAAAEAAALRAAPELAALIAAFEAVGA
ncbi:hypothetical protein [Fuscibacter oryzae]|uniref:Uncharacterized protein n=1 Tax=Fuscibacter oryzae TaxID=2803939 RepID=A0A8J7SVB2_9RHOB|nr:hypothetical protein [Fuscibacter oryzae]MBL4929342.1 hypothetical protein [Fuscibacter oryzae]